MILIVCALIPEKAESLQSPLADVVVIVDTSTSMKNTGYDPERTSLLVSKLLSDVVPGELAVVRLLDIQKDKYLIPGTKTGEKRKCWENPENECEVIEQTSNWEEDARKEKFGVEVRDSRGSFQFKEKLNDHLTQNISNSMFNLAFKAAQGIFEDHSKIPKLSILPKTIIWLSDGKIKGAEALLSVIEDLKRLNVTIEAIVFGKGETKFAKRAGLNPVQVSSPGDLMKAFADSLRRIFRAPYRKDNLVSINSKFDMKPNVDEAWVVIYGDASLSSVTLQGPSSKVLAEYAQETQPPAGAYRVAYLQAPQAGQWHIQPTNGGPEVAFAVIQRSALTPALLAPKKVPSGIMTTLVVGIKAGLEGKLVSDEEIVQNATVTAHFQGQKLTLVDDGSQGDETPNDGRFSAQARFQGTGTVPVQINFSNYIADKTVNENVEVTGIFKYIGDPVSIDLGSLQVNMESCGPLPLKAQRLGEVPLKLQSLKSLPSGLNLEMRKGTNKIHPDSESFISSESDKFQVCLVTAPNATSSTSDNTPWLKLQLENSDATEHQVTILLTWNVQGLSFWEKWGIYILWTLFLLFLAFIMYGFISPQRFQPSLALVFDQDRDDLEEQTAQPLQQWKGVRIGFYRDAHAYLHSDFRLSGNKKGAIAFLLALKKGAQVFPGKGNSLFRENIDGDWDQVKPEGRKSTAGDVYRYERNQRLDFIT